MYLKFADTYAIVLVPLQIPNIPTISSISILATSHHPATTTRTSHSPRYHHDPILLRFSISRRRQQPEILPTIGHQPSPPCSAAHPINHPCRCNVTPIANPSPTFPTWACLPHQGEFGPHSDCISAPVSMCLDGWNVVPRPMEQFAKLVVGTGGLDTIDCLVYNYVDLMSLEGRMFHLAVK
jgi:hypothetical protein